MKKEQIIGVSVVVVLLIGVIAFFALGANDKTEEEIPEETKQTVELSANNVFTYNEIETTLLEKQDEFISEELSYEIWNVNHEDENGYESMLFIDSTPVLVAFDMIRIQGVVQDLIVIELFDYENQGTHIINSDGEIIKSLSEYGALEDEYDPYMVSMRTELTEVTEDAIYFTNENEDKIGMLWACRDDYDYLDEEETDDSVSKDYKLVYKGNGEFEDIVVVNSLTEEEYKTENNIQCD